MAHTGTRWGDARRGVGRGVPIRGPPLFHMHPWTRTLKAPYGLGVATPGSACGLAALRLPWDVWVGGGPGAGSSVVRRGRAPAALMRSSACVGVPS